ncbi:MAG: TolC family outer membrane protein [Rhizomicrobium sp.]|jgi:outer membrane protein
MSKLGVTALAVFLGTAAAQAQTFSLKEALATAYETNPQLDAQRAALRATDEGVAQANANWRPTINFQGSYGYQDTLIGGARSLPPSFGVSSAATNHPLLGQVVISQPLFRGGRTWAEIGRAKSQVRAGAAQLTDVEEGVLLDAVTAYMDVVRDAATVRLRQNNVAVLQKQLDATQEQFKVGELTRTDVAQSQARLAGAQADLTAAVGQLQISRSNFEHFVGRPAELLQEHPAFPPLPLSESAAIDGSLELNPTVVAAKENERASDYAVDDAAGALLPQLSIQGQYQYAHNPAQTELGVGNNEHITAVTGQLTIPIYQGGGEEASVRQAKQLDAQAKLNIADAQRQVVDATRTAWESYASAVAAIQSNKAQVDANTVALDGVHQEQQVGSRTILDVLNAEQELLNSQVAVVSSERNAEVAAYQVLSATGKLTARDLGLPVKLYDPKEYYDDNAGRWFGLGD